MKQSKRSARHPLHPLCTHFPVALLGISPFWELAGLFRPEPVWWELSFRCMAAGLAGALLALVTGFVDYLAIPETGPALKVANRHLVWVLAAVALFAGNLLVRGGSHPPVGLYRSTACFLSVAGLMALGIGGWHGGELVYRHGIGRRQP